MPPDFDDNISIQFEQGQAGDCYLLAVIDCLRHLNFKDKEGENHFNSLFKKNDDGSIEVTLNGSKDMSARLIKPGQAKAEYEYKHDSINNKDWFKISPDKLKAIKEDSKSSTSEAIEILVLERLVSYYIENRDSNLNNSIDAHDTSKRDFGNKSSNEFLAELFGIHTFKIDNIQGVEHVKHYLPNHPIYISMDWGRADQHGNFHGRHALRIDEILYDKNGEAHFKLVNPWNNKERWHYTSKQLTERYASFSVFELDQKELEVVKDLSRDYPMQLKEDLQFLLFKAYPKNDYPDFYNAVANTTDTLHLSELLYIHTKLTSYSNNLTNYALLVEVDANLLNKIKQLRTDLSSNKIADFKDIEKQLKSIKAQIITYQNKLIEEHSQLVMANRKDRRAMGVSNTSKNKPEESEFHPRRANAAEFNYELNLQKKKQECYKILRVISALGAESKLVKGLAESVSQESNLNNLDQDKRLLLNGVAETSKSQKIVNPAIDFKALEINDALKAEIESRMVVSEEKIRVPVAPQTQPAVIAQLKKQINARISSIFSELNPEQAKKDIASAIKNYSQDELSSFNDLLSNTDSLVNECKLSVKKLSNFASINPKITDDIARFNLRITNTLNDKNYDYIETINSEIQARLEEERDRHIERCKNLEERLNEPTMDYTQQGEFAIASRLKSLISKSDIHTLYVIVNNKKPTSGDMNKIRDYKKVIPENLDKDSLNEILKQVRTAQFSPGVTDNLIKILENRLKGLEQERIESLKLSKQVLTKAISENNNRKLIQLTGFDFSRINDESQLIEIRETLGKVQVTNDIIENDLDSIDTLSNEKIPVSLSVQSGDKNIDEKLRKASFDIKAVLEQKQVENEEVVAINTTLIDKIKKDALYYDMDSKCKDGVQKNTAARDNSIGEISARNKKLLEIQSIIAKTNPILKVIKDYENATTASSLFSSSKSDKAKKIKSAYMEIPLDCRDKIFGDLKGLDNMSKNSILSLRKELLTHRNIFNKILHPVKNKNVEDITKINSTSKLTSSFKKALDGCKKAEDESKITDSNKFQNN